MRGQWSGLAMAALFTLFINTAIAATFLDPPWVAGIWLAVLWIGVGGCWLVGFVVSQRQLIRGDQSPIEFADEEESANQVDLFPQAQSEYLKGSWFEAERLIRQATEQRPHDIDAHLLLATLFRRTERLSESREQLQRLESIAGAEKWTMEIYRERELLDQEEEERLSDESATDHQAA